MAALTLYHVIKFQFGHNISHQPQKSKASDSKFSICNVIGICSFPTQWVDLNEVLVVLGIV